MNESKRRQNQSDPTAERTSEQSTQTASGLSGGRRGPEVASEREADEVINRDREDEDDQTRTPRKYEEGATDPALPSDDATLNTKI